MSLVCNLNKCVGCMTCTELCPKAAIHIEDSLDAFNAVIDESLCCNCNLCHTVCQNNRIVSLHTPMQWYQGYANDSTVRTKSSSGGVGAALMKAFIAQGGCVCACLFCEGQFRFEFTEHCEDIDRFIGSKYVKSNPLGVYKKLKSILASGKRILFIGLPCQVAAVKCYVGNQYSEQLYTVDLICHGSPTPRLLEQFLEEHGCPLKDASELAFRQKNKFNLYYNRQQVSLHNTRDAYTIAFLNGLDYTENCYHCQYARFDRVGDLTLGDSWGSELDAQERRKGISLILCQNDRGRELISIANVNLQDVDIDRARKSNHQLNDPTPIPRTRSRFFSLLKKGVSFDLSVARCLPKAYFKEIIRKWLIVMKIR